VDVRAIVRGWMEARAALETPGTAPGVASAPAAEVVPPPVKVAILVVPEVAAPAAPPPAESAAPAEAVPEVAATPPATATTPDPLAMVPTREAPDVTALLLSSADLARRAPGRIVVRPGDTLWDIAARVYGEGSRYRTIYEANRDILRRPGLLRPGQVLEIPLVYD
jgi:nucleoid-associated protein YgaU